MDFEQVIIATGYGRFHLKLICCGCLGMLSAGCQYALNGFIIPTACDLNMTTKQMGLVNVLFLSGGVTSAYICGVLADMFGRKKIILMAFVLDTVVTVITSLSQQVELLLFCRFFTGLLIGVPASLIVPYIGEFHEASRRATSISYICFFWALSWLVVAVCAALIIPITWSFESAHFTFNSWRMFVAVFAIPNAMSALFLTLLPESPRILLSTGKTQEAMTVLQEMYQVNTRKNRDEYPITLAELSTVKEHTDVDYSTDDVEARLSCSRFFVQMMKQTRTLFRRSYLKYTAICSSLMFANMVGAYGLGLWLPELITHYNEHKFTHEQDTLTVCELSKYMNTRECNAERVLNREAFYSNAVIGAACMLGPVFFCIFGKIFDTQVIIAFPMMIAAFSSFAIYYSRSSVQITVAACVFEMGVEIAYFGMYQVVIDSFPTNIRAMAMCTSVLAGRIGAILINIVFGEFLDTHCEVPIFLVACVLAVGAVIGMCAPSKKTSSSEPKQSSSEHEADKYLPSDSL